MSSIVLICAVVASLAVGVVVAHVVCQTMFAAFRMHARQLAVTSALPKVLAQGVEA